MKKKQRKLVISTITPHIKKISFLGFVCIAGGVNSQTVNWATWNLWPNRASYPETYDRTGVDPASSAYQNLDPDDVWGSKYDTGIVGSVVDPASLTNYVLRITGEISSFSTANFSWSTHVPAAPGYVTTIPSTAMLAQTGYSLPQWRDHTLTFSAPVTNALMAVFSLGASGEVSTLTFTQPFQILSSRNRFESGGNAQTGYTLTGEEGHGLIQFLGTYDTITWTVSAPEVFSGFNIGFTSTPYIVPITGPLPSDTLVSFSRNSSALRNAFNVRSVSLAIGLTYDCTVYDHKNICVSFAGSKSDGKGFDATTGALIIAHKPTNNFRFGGYIDQSFGSDSYGGLTTKKGNPGFGVFAVWSQNADGSGVQVRAAANVAKVDIETTREAIGTAEAGFGQSNIKSQGFSLEVSKDYAINSMWTARPYVGYRQTTSKRAGYTEQSSNDVTAPLTYSSLKQTTETLTVGATFAHTLSAKTTMYLTAGIEHDLKNRIGDYAATSSTIGDIDSINMSSDKTKTRPTVSFALDHAIDKTQRVGVSLTHRKEAFASGSTTSAFLQYSKGF